MNKKEFSKTIKTLRAKSGLSQSQFAEKLDVRRSTVQNWEYGTTMPSKSMVRMVIEKLSLEEYEYPELFTFAYSADVDTESAEEKNEGQKKKEATDMAAAPAEGTKEEVRRKKLPPLAETAIIAASFWLFFAMVAITVFTVNYIATPYTPYTIVFYKKYVFADVGAIAVLAIFSFIAITGIPVLIRLIILLRCGAKKIAAALVALTFLLPSAVVFKAENAEKNVAYASGTEETIEEEEETTEEDIDGKATNIITLTSLMLCEGVGGKIIAAVTNDFTFFSSTASVRLSLYFSETTTEEISEMTLVSTIYSSDLHSGKYLSVSANASGTEGYWLCRATYYKSPSAEIFSSTPCFFSSSGKAYPEK